MSKEIYISSTPHETRLAIVESDELTEIYYERENEYTLAGSIYNGKVTRVLPGMQSSFVDVGLERDAFLYITDFMEEAGDSAEFDSADGASGSRRGGSNDRNGSREDRAPRDEAVAPREDATGSGDRLAAPSSDPRTDRGDREGGRRRRGNRDGRNPNRENRDAVDDRAAGQRDRSAESRAPLQSPLEPGFDTAPAVHSGFTEPGIDTSSAELGEGAPGADGSRRWRGRRGRRRGRTSVQREESLALHQPGVTQDAGQANLPQQADFASAEEPEEDFVQEYNDSFDLSASAPAAPESASAQREFAEPAVPQQAAAPRDRGDREPRDRNRHDRGGRDRDSRSPRAPRGFAPSRDLYGVDTSSEAEELEGGSAPEPIVLPGESLAKYRKGDEQGPGTASASEPTTPSAPRPSTEYRLQGAWDGSGVLPGETLRPRSDAPSAQSTSDRARGDRNDGRSSRDRGGRDDRRGRDDRSRGRGDDRGDRNRSRSSAEATPITPTPVLTPQQSPDEHSIVSEVSAHTAPGQEESFAQLNPSASETGAHPVTQGETRPTAMPEPAEYEPTEASASVRFDPTTRSEFRQSAPAIEEPVQSPVEEALPQGEISAASEGSHSVEANAGWTHDGGSPASSFDSSTPQAEEVHSIAHTITPQPQAPVEPLHLSPFEEPATPHEFTSIQNTGDMLSEAPSPVQSEVADPTSPLQHEAAVLDSPSQSAHASEAPSGHFEEVIEEDEEDFSGTTLHASSIEEMDYEEEQNLEGAADLGTMIREMSIDQITHPIEDPDEDDILEEEDAVDDEFNESFDGSDEDEDEEHGTDEGSTAQDRVSFADSAPTGQDHLADSSTSADTRGSSFETSRDPDRRSSRREGGRRDGRRDGRGRDRDRGGDRARSTGGSGDRSTSRPGRRDGRHSAQTTNLPAISDLLKPGQEVLVQIAKEPIAKKGARITSHIALPGRFLVFMPTVNHTGVSRKIESDGERRRLKEILLSEKGEASGGFIVRTAASGASEEELRSDLRFLLNLWADIKQRSESSKSPALIYHDLNLVERILRDQVTDTFSAIWVDTETEYERVLRFLQRFQPSLIRRVKLYTKETPLFEQFGITEEINKALRSKVWLKSGGSIVINQTEALVAIDINTGKYVGKTARLEDTIVKTNLDAIPEIVRQIRLRDLGGIIIIDFIDMDERKNRHKVMAVLEEELKKDRAPSKVLQFNDFGLVAITRKRVKQSLERTLSATCAVCQGTGMTKSPVTVCNDIYIEMRKMQKHLDRGDIMLRVNPEVVKQLKAPGTKWLQEMEDMVGKTILVKSDPSLHPEQFDIH